MIKIISAVLTLLIIVAAGFYVINSSSASGVVVSDAPNSEVKTFVLTGENFKFVLDGLDNPDIVVNEGDRVRIEFSSTNGFHDFIIDEFNVSTERVRETDDSTFVEFVADKAGNYEYYCSVGQHRANGMWGEFIVQ